jgi:hypothetical protein
LSTPSLIRVTGTLGQLAQLGTIAGFNPEVHGQARLDDGRATLFARAASDATIAAIRAVGADVEILLTSDQLRAQLERISGAQGGGVTVAGDVFVAFHAPLSDPVPDDFTLTLTPSAGTPLTFEKGDAADRGDGLLSFRVTNPALGVAYAARATLSVGDPEVVVFDGFELHALLLETLQPDRPAQPPAIFDPLALETPPTPDPDGSSEPDVPLELEEGQLADFLVEAERDIGVDVGIA